MPLSEPDLYSLWRAIEPVVDFPSADEDRPAEDLADPGGVAGSVGVVRLAIRTERMPNAIVVIVPVVESFPFRPFSTSTQRGKWGAGRRWPRRGSSTIGILFAAQPAPMGWLAAADRPM